MEEERLIEIVVDTKGNELWREDPYPFRRLSAVGERFVHNSIEYRVKSSRLVGNEIRTVVQKG